MYVCVCVLHVYVYVSSSRLGSCVCRTWPFLRRLQQHYKQQALTQLYMKVPGSLDIIGSPVGLLSSLGSGVADFFFEPAKGMTESPQEFMEGVLKVCDACW